MQSIPVDVRSIQFVTKLNRKKQEHFHTPCHHHGNGNNYNHQRVMHILHSCSSLLLNTHSQLAPNTILKLYALFVITGFSMRQSAIMIKIYLLCTCLQQHK